MRTRPPHGPEADDAPLLRGALRAGANWWLPVTDFLAVLLSEFRRAVAAEQRYEDLKRMDAVTLARHGRTSAGITRHLFEEVYSCASEGGGEAWVSAELALHSYPLNRDYNKKGPSG